MSRQDDFVRYSFTGKTPKRFDILSGCSIDRLKDVIKQVALQGISPYGIQNKQQLIKH